MTSEQQPAVTQYRNGFADTLKGLAVLFMVQVHLTETFALASLQSSSVGKISMFLGGPVAAPVFLMILGYFAAASKKTFNKKLYRGIKLLLGGLLLNIGLNASLLYKIATGSSVANPYHFIFGVDILFTAGLSILLLTILEKALRQSPWIAILLAMVSVQAAAVLSAVQPESGTVSSFVFALFGGNYSWSYFPVFPWLAYPLTGYAVFHFFKNYNPSGKLNSKIITVIFGVSTIIALYYFQFGFDTSVYLDAYYHHSLAFYGWTLCFLTAYAIAVYSITPHIAATAIGKYLAWTGRQVTAFYVFQWLIIGNIATHIYRTQNELSLTLWFFGITAVVSLLVYIWDKKLQIIISNIQEYLTQTG